MVLEIRYTDPRSGRPEVRSLSYVDEPFIVGRSESSTVALTPADLSRVALMVSAHPGERLKIESLQRPGYVQVLAEDGLPKATLNHGEELICGRGVYRVLVRTASSDILELTAVVPETPRIAVPGELTQGMWNRQQILRPTDDDAGEWRWLAALTTLAAQTRAPHQGKALMALANAWHGGDWKANLHDRLDKVIRHLQLTVTGTRKQEAIAAWVRSSGVIAEADYRVFRAEVQTRAMAQLSRAEIGSLNWGYLYARGPQ